MSGTQELMEADLHRLWQRGLFPKDSLRTTEDQPIEVLYAGVWNRDAGPDFRNAILRVGNKLVKGDVEIHLEPELWYGHRHHTDPAYNAVVLHVALEVGDPRPIVREDGVGVAQIVLPAEAVAAIVSPLRRPEVDQLIVQSCPLRHRDPPFVQKTILAAAEERLTDKAARFAEQLGQVTWDQILYRGICEALGYAVNQVPFRKLAERLPVDRIMTEMRLAHDPLARERVWALLFGAAGLLPSQARPPASITDPDLREFVRPLDQFWQESAHRRRIHPLRPEEWQFFRLRPANFPTRRLAALGLLLPRFSKDGLLGRIVRIFDAQAESPKRLARELERLFVVPAEGVWRRVSRLDRDPDLRSKGMPSSLLGGARAREIVTNVVLPVIYLYGTDSGDGRIVNLVREVFAVVPKLSDNVITRAMEVQLSHALLRNRGRTSAGTQQGLVQLHKLYCQPLRCDECQRLSEHTDRLTLRLRDRIETLRRRHQ